MAARTKQPRTVYMREVADARRRAFRRSAMAAEFQGVLDAADAAATREAKA